MPSAWRVRTVFSGVAGTPWVSNHYIDTSTGGSASDAVAAVAAFWNVCDGSMKTTVSWFTETEVPLFLNPDTVTGIESAASISGNGAQSGDSLPYQTQGLIAWSTSTIFQNRRVVGRTFVPAPDETYNTATGTPSGTYTTLLNGAATTLAGEGLVIASRAMNSFVPVTGQTVRAKWAVLRSRRD